MTLLGHVKLCLIIWSCVYLLSRGGHNWMTHPQETACLLPWLDMFLLCYGEHCRMTQHIALGKIWKGLGNWHWMRTTYEINLTFLAVISSFVI